MLRKSKSPCPKCGKEMSQVAKICWECRKAQNSAICPICKKEYKFKASTNRKTCSIECSYVKRGMEYSKNHFSGGISKCLTCDREIKYYPSRERKFCSRKCWYEFNIKENNSQWKGGITPEREALYKTKLWKRRVVQVWERDKATCQICSTPYEHPKMAFEIHHIVPFHSKKHRTSLNNLVLLCYKCHKWVHSKKNVEKVLIR